MKLARDITCAEIVELVTDYFEGGLSVVDRERFEEHIGYCDWCLTYLDQMRETVAAAGRLREDELPPQLQQGLLDAFREWQGP
jgi:predicted anti-sigma-YlaC factor YlaD